MPDIGRVEPPSPPDRLEHLEILFEQGDDGKDRDTSVLVELLGRDNRLLATYYHAQFPDHEYPSYGYAYETLEIQGTVTPNDTSGSHLRIKIVRNGNDHWDVTWHLLFRWASGSLLHSSRVVTELGSRTPQGDEFSWPVNIQPDTASDHGAANCRSA